MAVAEYMLCYHHRITQSLYGLTFNLFSAVITHNSNTLIPFQVDTWKLLVCQSNWNGDFLLSIVISSMLFVIHGWKAIMRELSTIMKELSTAFP